MIGYLLAFFSALFDSFRLVFAKFLLRKESAFGVASFLRLGTAVLAFPFLLLIGFPDLNNFVFSLGLLAASLNSVATFFYMKAVKSDDLSLVVPFLSLVPIFLILTSYLILGEVLPPFGILGVILISIGSMFLVYEGISLRSKGVLYILVVVFIYSVAANLDKLGVLSSSPLFWIVFVNFFSGLLLLPFAFVERKFDLRDSPKFLMLALFATLTLFAQLSALKFLYVPYVISIKRLGILFSVLFGMFIFGEKRAIRRLLFSILMLLGLVLLTLS